MITVAANYTFENTCDILKEVASKSLTESKKQAGLFPLFKRKDIQIMKNLAKNDTIIICKPDKGRGIVILNKSKYINKMENVLDDTAKFQKITDSSIFKLSLKFEDKINRFVKKLLDENKLTQDEYKYLHTSSSGPGVMYGLPKIHKNNIPLTILAVYQTSAYNLAKYLVPLLTPYTLNSYTVKNSSDFIEELKKVNVGAN